MQVLKGHRFHSAVQQHCTTAYTSPQAGPTFIRAVVAAADEDALEALRQALYGRQLMIVALQAGRGA